MLYAILPIGGTEKYVTQGSRLHITFDKYKVLSLHKLPTKFTIENQNISQGGFVMHLKKLEDIIIKEKLELENFLLKLKLRKYIHVNDGNQKIGWLNK